MMDIEDIRRHLPHRYPFLFVDRVVSIDPGVSIEAYKNLSINEPYFDGHFPGNPVFPGVLLWRKRRVFSGSQPWVRHLKMAPFITLLGQTSCGLSAPAFRAIG